MTRFCIRCNQIIGEKRVRCGTGVIAVSDTHAVTGAVFDCPSCSHSFLQGDGGATGGMCEPCFDAELRNAHEEAAKNPAKMSLWAGNSHRKDCQYKTPKVFLFSEENLAR